MSRLPSRVSREAQRPAMFWLGVSSQRTSFMASATLCLPPDSDAANRSSVSISRSELPIQSAVGWCPAAIITIRSWVISSSEKPDGVAHHQGGGVAAGRGVFVDEQFRHRPGEVTLPRERALTAVDHVVEGGDESGPLGVAEAVELREDADRQEHGVVGR